MVVYRPFHILLNVKGTAVLTDHSADNCVTLRRVHSTPNKFYLKTNSFSIFQNSWKIDEKNRLAILIQIEENR